MNLIVLLQGGICDLCLWLFSVINQSCGNFKMTIQFLNDNIIRTDIARHILEVGFNNKKKPSSSLYAFKQHKRSI